MHVLFTMGICMGISSRMGPPQVERKLSPGGICSVRCTLKIWGDLTVKECAFTRINQHLCLQGVKHQDWDMTINNCHVITKVRIWLAKIKIWPLKMGRNRESHHHRIIGSFTIIETLASVDTVPDFLWFSMQMIFELLKMGIRDISKDWKVEHLKPQKVGSNSGSRGNLLVWVRRFLIVTLFLMQNLMFLWMFSGFRWGNFQFLMAELCWTPIWCLNIHNPSGPLAFPLAFHLAIAPIGRHSTRPKDRRHRYTWIGGDGDGSTPKKE